jgi:hypothetical protein
MPVKLRFLNLITIVEILSKGKQKQEPQSETLVSLVNEFMGQVDKSALSLNEKNWLKQRLINFRNKREMRKRDKAKELITDHLDDKDVKFFNHCYIARNDFLHDGIIPDEVHDNALLGDGTTPSHEILYSDRLNSIVQTVLLKSIQEYLNGSFESKS